ncbi:MAG: hypothetical protein AAGC47_08160 [Bacteroidota bacterium]
MRIGHFIALVLMLLTISMEGHSPHQAHFTIEQASDKVIVMAEFPWTLRNALFEYSPELKEAREAEQFNLTLKDYVNENLILRNDLGAKIPLLNVEEIEDHGHSHSGTYLLTYAPDNVASVQNSLMFNLSEKHKNFHSLTTESAVLKFQTNHSSLDFEVTVREDKGTSWYLFLFLLVPLIIAVVKTTLSRKSIPKSLPS